MSASVSNQRAAIGPKTGSSNAKTALNSPVRGRAVSCRGKPLAIGWRQSCFEHHPLAHQVPVLDLRDLLQGPEDYSTASPIEPSEMGGKKIAQALQSWLPIEHGVQARC